MWTLLLFVLAVILIFLEFFLPGGILGVLGALSLLASIITAYAQYSLSVGMLIMVGELVGAFVLLAVGLKLFPRTWAGKRMILSTTLDDSHGYTGDTVILKQYLGQTGAAESDLRPAGVARIQGKRVDAVAEGQFVDKGTEVKVIEVEGNRVVVRPVPRSANAEPADDASAV